MLFPGFNQFFYFFILLKITHGVAQTPNVSWALATQIQIKVGPDYLDPAELIQMPIFIPAKLNS